MKKISTGNDRLRRGCVVARLAIVLSSAIAVSGCATTSGPATLASGQAVAPAAPGSVLDFVSKAAVGQSTSLTNGGSTQLVTIVSDYYAASGRSCRQYSVKSDGRAPELHVGCSGSPGWTELRPLVATDAAGLPPATR